MKSKIKIRTDVLQKWQEVNPVLLNGEIAYVSDTKSWRIGNGAWRFSELQNFPLAPNSSYNDLANRPTLGTAAATDASAYATAAQGTKADSALQPAALTPYRTSAAQDTIDAGKAASSHTHALIDLTQSGATNDQVPTWNGTAWVPATPASGGLTLQPTSPELRYATVPNSALVGLWFVGLGGNPNIPLSLTPNATATEYRTSYGSLSTSGYESVITKNLNGSWTWTHQEKSGPASEINTRSETSSIGNYPYPNHVVWPSAGITGGTLIAEAHIGPITDGGGVPKLIEITEAQYAALSPARVDQTATYIVNSTTNQNATTYQGKEFGGSKPVSLLSQPVVIGSANRVSPTINIGSIDWIQVSPIDPTKFYFSQNIGSGASAAMWRGTLTRDSVNRISGGTNSYGGQQAAAFEIFNGTKGGGIYDADTVFIPDERISSTDNSGRILKVDLATNTTSEAWNFKTSTPAVLRADIASQFWYTDDCIVDRANNKLFVGSGSPSTNSNGSSVARFSIDPTTKTLTPDEWVKAVTANGSGINFVRRLTLLPDGYIFVANHNLSTNTPSFQTFNAYGSASGNATSVGISYASANIVQGVAFKADVNAPSGIGYILIAPRNGSEKGKIYAYDYQGAGSVNTTATDIIDLTTISKNAGLYTNSLKLEIGAIAVTPDGAILVGIRSGTTTPIPRSVIAFNWVPYAKSGTLSTQNSDNVNITGGSINGVRNLTPKVEYITSSCSWWKDEAARFIRVQAWSAGGGGGSGRKDSTGTVVRSGGGGGGGGGYIDIMMDASTVNTVTVPVTITIGGGGAGGVAQATNATNGNNGTQGGNTSWSSVLIVLGGNGGFGGNLTGANGGTGSLNGNAGGAAAADGFGLSGFPGSIVAPVGVGGVGGGSGGGLNASNAMFAGGVGGISFYGVLGVAAAGGTTNGGNGAAGNNTTGIYQVGGGGGGGGSHTTGNGGSGGAGGFGSGGGGGGASQNGNSGAGGVGGNGFMIVTTYY